MENGFSHRNTKLALNDLCPKPIRLRAMGKNTCLNYLGDMVFSNGDLVLTDSSTRDSILWNLNRSVFLPRLDNSYTDNNQSREISLKYSLNHKQKKLEKLISKSPKFKLKIHRQQITIESPKPRVKTIDFKLDSKSIPEIGEIQIKEDKEHIQPSAYSTYLNKNLSMNFKIHKPLKIAELKHLTKNKYNQKLPQLVVNSKMVLSTAIPGELELLKQIKQKNLSNIIGKKYNKDY